MNTFFKFICDGVPPGDGNMLVLTILWWMLWSVWVLHAGFMSVLVAILIFEGALWAWRRKVSGIADSADASLSSIWTDRVVEEDEVTEVYRTQREVVQVRRMPAGGDSLVKAVSHQLRRGAAQVEAEDWQVRDAVALHVTEHLSQYRPALLRSIADMRDRYADVLSEEVQVLHYLQDVWMPGHPPGHETLQVIADKYAVHIDVFPEDGIKERTTSSQKTASATVSLGLGSRILHHEDGTPRNHYDSVISWTSLQEPTQTHWYIRKENGPEDSVDYETFVTAMDSQETLGSPGSPEKMHPAKTSTPLAELTTTPQSTKKKI